MASRGEETTGVCSLQSLPAGQWLEPTLDHGGWAPWAATVTGEGMQIQNIWEIPKNIWLNI